MDEGDGGDQMDQFHRYEAISAVADEGFIGYEDDDYEDLYNDVNVGEGFRRSMKKNDDVGFRNEEQQKVESAVGAPEPKVLIPGVGGETSDAASGAGVSGVSGGYGGPGLKASEVSQQIPSGPVAGMGGGLRLEVGVASFQANDVEVQSANNSAQGLVQQPANTVNSENLTRQEVANVNGVGTPVSSMVGNGGVVGGSGVGSGITAGPGTGGGSNGTTLFVGDLHWWTTDAELEAELCKYGTVKEVKFFDEKASGKSKGYCQVEFYDPTAATACKEGMNGHLFNGRPSVVAYASPYTVKRMGEAQVNRSPQMAQAAIAQAKRGGPTDAVNKPAVSNNAAGGAFQGGDNRGYGRGNWGRGGSQGMGGRGPVGPMRNRPGGMGGRGIMGNGGGGFGQGIGSGPLMMTPQTIMGQGFDPLFGGPMARMGGYGGFPGGPAPPFPGLLSSFPRIGGVGLPGVAPHVNPAFFGRGMPMNGVGMIPTGGVDGGPHIGMWSEPMGGWGGEEIGGGRAAESSYGEEAASDHQFGEVSHDRGDRPNPVKEKERTSEREWSGSLDRRYHDDKVAGHEREIPREKDADHDRSERKHRDDRDTGRERERDHHKARECSRDHDREAERERERDRERDRERERDRHRDERERHGDHRRYRDHEPDHDNGWDRGRSPRTNSKARLSKENDHRSRSRDVDYVKRRRLTSE